MQGRLNAKAKYFEYLEKTGKMPKKPQEESEDEMSYHEMQGYAQGGLVDSEDDFDWDEGHAKEYDSSGEPHTEDEVESEHPMEFMSRGGRLRRMAKGGMVHKSNFAKALRKAY